MKPQEALNLLTEAAGQLNTNVQVHDSFRLASGIIQAELLRLEALDQKNDPVKTEPEPEPDKPDTAPKDDKN